MAVQWSLWPSSRLLAKKKAISIYEIGKRCHAGRRNLCKLCRSISLNS